MRPNALNPTLPAEKLKKSPDAVEIISKNSANPPIFKIAINGIIRAVNAIKKPCMVSVMLTARYPPK